MANTTTKFKTEVIKPVFAYVGATDLAVEKVRDYVADVQKRVTAAQKVSVEARINDLQNEAKGYPAKVQHLVEENVAAANAAYTDLIKRGESLVGRIRRQEATKATVTSAKTTVAKAKATTTQAKKAVEAEIDAADKAAANKVAPKTTAKKAAAKKGSATRAKNAAAKKAETARASAKATVTAAEKTAANAAHAVVDAVEKVGD